MRFGESELQEGRRTQRSPVGSRQCASALTERGTSDQERGLALGKAISELVFKFSTMMTVASSRLHF